MSLHFSGPESRHWTRLSCGSAGILLTPAGERPVTMVDASRGGYKLRFDPDPDILAALSPQPRDLNVLSLDDRRFGSSVLWVRGDLAGCRFQLHLSLDDIALLMTKAFRLQPGETAPV